MKGSWRCWMRRGDDCPGPPSTVVFWIYCDGKGLRGRDRGVAPCAASADGTNTDGFHLVQLACSRDLKNWKRLGDRQPFIGASPRGGGAYDLTGVLNFGWGTSVVGKSVQVAPCLSTHRRQPDLTQSDPTASQIVRLPIDLVDPVLPVVGQYTEPCRGLEAILVSAQTLVESTRPSV